MIGGSCYWGWNHTKRSIRSQKQRLTAEFAGTCASYTFCPFVSISAAFPIFCEWTSCDAVFTQVSLMAYLQIWFVPVLYAQFRASQITATGSEEQLFRQRKTDKPLTARLTNDVHSAIYRYCDLDCRRIRCSYQKYPLPNSLTKQKQKIAPFTSAFLCLNSSSERQTSAHTR